MNIFIVKNIIFENVTNQQITNDLEKYKNKNIFLINTKEINNEISNKYPEITNLKIMRGLPDTLKIQLIDQKPRLIWWTNEKKYLIDSSGVVYKEAAGQEDLPVIKDNTNMAVTTGQTIVTEGFEKFISELDAKFTDTTGFNVDNFELNETLFQVDAITDQGWSVKFDTTRKVDDQLNDLKKFLAQNTDKIGTYVDVRVEGKVYYK